MSEKANNGPPETTHVDSSVEDLASLHTTLDSIQIKEPDLGVSDDELWAFINDEIGEKAENAESEDKTHLNEIPNEVRRFLYSDDISKEFLRILESGNEDIQGERAQDDALGFLLSYSAQVKKADQANKEYPEVQDQLGIVLEQMRELGRYILDNTSELTEKAWSLLREEMQVGHFLTQYALRGGSGLEDANNRDAFVSFVQNKYKRYETFEVKAKRLTPSKSPQEVSADAQPTITKLQPGFEDTVEFLYEDKIEGFKQELMELLFADISTYESKPMYAVMSILAVARSVAGRLNPSLKGNLQRLFEALQHTRHDEAQFRELLPTIANLIHYAQTHDMRNYEALAFIQVTNNILSDNQTPLGNEI